MGLSPGLKSIHPGSTFEAPIGLIKKTSTKHQRRKNQRRSPNNNASSLTIGWSRIDFPRPIFEALDGLVKQTSISCRCAIRIRGSSRMSDWS